MRCAVALLAVATNHQLAIGLQGDGGRGRASIIYARKMGPDLAARTKTWVKTSIRVIAGQHKIIELAIRSGAAYARHDDFAVSLNDNPPGFRALIPEVSLDAAIRSKCLVKTAIDIKAGEEKSRRVGRAGGHDLAV